MGEIQMKPMVIYTTILEILGLPCVAVENNDNLGLSY